MRSYTISSPEQLQAPVQDIIKSGKKILLLEGPIGAGKTTLITEWVEQIAGKNTTVQSPTYTYFNSYNDLILHIDMRRIEQFSQLHELGFFELFDSHEYIAIERPKRTDQYCIPGSYLTIHIEKINTTTRSITIS